MAGLYDLDLDAQVLDDGAIGWDDPDFSFATVAPPSAASASGVAGNAASALGVSAGIGSATGASLSAAPTHVDGNLVTTGSLVMHL